MGIEIQFYPNDKEGRQTPGRLTVGTNFDAQPEFDSNQEYKPENKAQKRRNSDTSVGVFGGGRDDDILQRPRSNSLQSRPRSGFLSRYDSQSSSAVSPILDTDLSTLHKRFSRKESAHRIGAWLNTELDDYNRPTVTKDDSDLLYNKNDGLLIPDDHHVSHRQQLNHKQQHQEELHMSLVHPVASEIEIRAIIEERYASFTDHYNVFLLRQKLACWRQKTAQILEDNNNLEILAKNRDRVVLLGQGFKTWLITLNERRQTLETERFFFHLERRAKRARDLFLLAKAFTHWATTASDEIRRTSVARRHILRTRFFQAWREITAVNELKIRRHITRNFFAMWRRRQTDVLMEAEDSIAVFHENLMRHVFWTWFWTFCNRRAPIWWADRSKRRQMAPWTARLQNVERLRTVAVNHHEQKSKRRSCNIWNWQTRELTEMNEASMLFRRRTLFYNAFKHWHRAHILLPSSKEVRTKVKHGLSAKFLAMWLLRARQESQAGKLDCHKIKKEAWIAWNDKHKCRALQLRIGDRNVLQALYKWVLAERLILARRLSNQKMVRGSLIRMFQASSNSFDMLSQNMDTARQFCEQNRKHSILERWRLRLRKEERLEQRAVQCSSYPIQAGTVMKWLQYMHHIRQSHAWASDANFYFAATKALKTWRNATEISKREKRRVAYAHIRRQNKSKLASRVFSIWRQQSTSVTDMCSIASEIRSNRATIYGMNAFDRWRARTEEVLELESMYVPNYVKIRFYQWKHFLEEYDRLDIVAVKFYEDRLHMISMKKWGRLALQFRAHQHLVSELQDKNAKRSVRKMVLHWRHKLDEYGSPEVINHVERGVTRIGRVNGSESTQQAEAWSELGDDLDLGHWASRWAQGNEGMSRTAPGPGYLRTPSKRISTARTLTNLSSTTPIAPLSTPYERKLRAQLSGRSLSSHSRMANGNMLSKSRGFADLAEAGTKLDGVGY